MGRTLTNREISITALMLTVGLWICFFVGYSRGNSSQAPRSPQAPPIVVKTTKKVNTARYYDIRQGENGRWFAVVSDSGLYPSDIVWDVLDKLNNNTPPQVKKVSKSCCSPACTCGCNEGEPCTCDKDRVDNSIHNTQPVVPITTYQYYYPPTPTYYTPQASYYYMPPRQTYQMYQPTTRSIGGNC